MRSLRQPVGQKRRITAETGGLMSHAVQIGIEGVVGKRADSPYIGGRSKDWLKSKPAAYHDGWERPLRKPT